MIKKLFITAPQDYHVCVHPSVPLFAELVSESEILQAEDSKPNNVRYKRIQK